MNTKYYDYFKEMKQCYEVQTNIKPRGVIMQRDIYEKIKFEMIKIFVCDDEIEDIERILKIDIRIGNGISPLYFY